MKFDLIREIQLDIIDQTIAKRLTHLIDNGQEEDAKALAEEMCLDEVEDPETVFINDITSLPDEYWDTLGYAN
tara:strand:+ start:3830 stop:4048 length:219 start_codon:yes stop_codon:yes gene_type:complete